MGWFSTAAILAALCSALCLYSSRGMSGSNFQYAACNKLNNTFSPRTMGSWLFFLLGVCSEDLRIADLSRCWCRWWWSSSSSSNNSDSNSDLIAECFSIKVKYQHDNNQHRVKTLDRQLCSIGAQSSISRASVHPFPYTACVTADALLQWAVGSIPQLTTSRAVS